MEIWKTIKGFEDYQVSNLGRIKSLKWNKEKILKQVDGHDGYLCVCLNFKKRNQLKRVHKLVAIEFLNHIPCGMKLVINHKNFIRSDNRLENLEIVTARENSNRKHLKSSSQYVGVSWHKPLSKWRARIKINNINIYLGYFNNEYDAHLAYQNALLSSQKGEEILTLNSKK